MITGGTFVVETQLPTDKASASANNKMIQEFFIS